MKRIIIIGNLGQDAQTRQTATGKTFYSFSVAVSEKYTNQKGEEIEEKTWFDCLTSNTKLAKYLTKGKKVYVEGNPKINKYYSEKSGEFDAKITINTTLVRLLTPNDQPNAQSQPPPQKATKTKEQMQAEQAEQTHETMQEFVDNVKADDLPF